jgi:hypothetical protein
LFELFFTSEHVGRDVVLLPAGYYLVEEQFLKIEYPQKGAFWLVSTPASAFDRRSHVKHIACEWTQLF